MDMGASYGGLPEEQNGAPTRNIMVDRITGENLGFGIVGRIGKPGLINGSAW